MYAVDTNLLVYAHNADSVFHEPAKKFIESILNTRDDTGNFQVCIPAQVLVEFINVITWSRLESPLSLLDALRLVKQYLGNIPGYDREKTHITMYTDSRSDLAILRWADVGIAVNPSPKLCKAAPEYGFEIQDWDAPT